MKKLEIIPTVQQGIELALKNYLSIVVTVALYVVSLFIPYINVGTTIAMASLPAEMAKGTIINPLFIFDGKYRRNMGEFFILMSLMTGAVGVGFMFGIIPGIVIGYAWYIALILFVDKDMPALEALRESNKLTYGNKARIFGVEMVMVIALAIVVAVIGFIFGIGHVSWLIAIGAFINIVVAIFFVPAMLGAQAVIYKALTSPEEPAPASEETPAAPAPAVEETPAAPAKLDAE